jgi:hypothetical protein
MRRSMTRPVQSLARFETQRHGALAREINDLLQAGSAGAARDQDAIQRPARAQSFPNGMNAGQNARGRLSGMRSQRTLFRKYQCRKAAESGSMVW